MFHGVHISRLHTPTHPSLQRQGARGFKRIGKGSWKKPVACTNLKEQNSDCDTCQYLRRYPHTKSPNDVTMMSLECRMPAKASLKCGSLARNWLRKDSLRCQRSSSRFPRSSAPIPSFVFKSRSCEDTRISKCLKCRFFPADCKVCFKMIGK